MRLAVIIPYAGQCSHRAAALVWVTARYVELGWPIVVGEGNSDEWCKAQAVADALAHTDADMLVVADGDVSADNIEAAVDAVHQGAAWAVPHRKVQRLTPDATQVALAGGAFTRRTRLAQPPYTGIVGGGIVVLPRELYEKVPLDPRFQGWGGEDHSWGYALETLAGPPHRELGDLWHLWHPSQPRSTRTVGTAANEKLRRRYRDARKRPDAMRELLEEAKCGSNASSTVPPLSGRSPNPRLTKTSTAIR